MNADAKLMAAVADATDAVLARGDRAVEHWFQACATAASVGLGARIQEHCDRIHSALCAGADLDRPDPGTTAEFFWPWTDTANAATLAANGHTTAAHRAAERYGQIAEYAAALGRYGISHAAAADYVDRGGLEAATRVDLIVASTNSWAAALEAILVRGDAAELLAASGQAKSVCGTYLPGYCTNSTSVDEWGRHLPVAAWRAAPDHTLPLGWVAGDDAARCRVARELWFEFEGTLDAFAAAVRMIAARA